MIKATFASIVNSWDWFFFAPTSNLRTAARIRIAYAIALFLLQVGFLVDYEFYLEVIPTEGGRVSINQDTRTVLQLLEGSPYERQAIQVGFILWMLQTVLLGLGVAPRFQAACIFFWWVTFRHQNNLLFNGEDEVFRLLSFFLIFFPPSSYGGWSIYDWLGKKDSAKETKESLTWPMWPFRLVQIEVCLIFFSTVGLKLSGKPWIEGYAMTMVVQSDDLYGGYFNPDWMFGYTNSLKFLTYSTLVLEVLAPALLWFEKTRRPTLITVLLFHLSIDATMNLNLFHWIMNIGWSSFFIQPDKPLVVVRKEKQS